MWETDPHILPTFSSGGRVWLVVGSEMYLQIADATDQLVEQKLQLSLYKSHPIHN